MFLAPTTLPLTLYLMILMRRETIGFEPAFFKEQVYLGVHSPFFPAHWVLFLSSQRCLPYAPLSPTPPLLLCPLANLLGPCSFKYTFPFCDLNFSFDVLHKTPSENNHHYCLYVLSIITQTYILSSHYMEKKTEVQKNCHLQNTSKLLSKGARI